MYDVTTWLTNNYNIYYSQSNISQSKDNHTMKFGQVIEYNKRNIFFENHPENETERLAPDLFLFFFFKDL